MRITRIIDKSLAITNKLYHKQIIENSKTRLCIDCFYFYKVYKDDKIDKDYKNDNKNIIFEKSKCFKYGKIDIISGELQYEFAHNIRQLESKCGLKARNFEEK